jgi:hypothetical protein
LEPKPPRCGLQKHRRWKGENTTKTFFAVAVMLVTAASFSDPADAGWLHQRRRRRWHRRPLRRTPRAARRSRRLSCWPPLRQQARASKSQQRQVRIVDQRIAAADPLTCETGTRPVPEPADHGRFFDRRISLSADRFDDAVHELLALINRPSPSLSRSLRRSGHLRFPLAGTMDIAARWVLIASARRL